MNWPDRLVTAAEVADRLGMSPEWVQEQARLGHLPGQKYGREWRFWPDELEETLRGWGRGEGPRYRKHHPRVEP